MELIHQAHQVHFFANNLDVEPNAQVISTINNYLPEFKLVPSSAMEINPVTSDRRNFLVMDGKSGANRVRIEFLREDIVFHVEGSPLEEFRQLADNVHNKLAEIFRFKQANRLSIISSRVYLGDEQEYQNLYKKLFTYKKISPFEWDNRIAERKVILGVEQINSISLIKRAEITSPVIRNGQPTDVICVELDINTIYQNQDRRFNFENAKPIYDALFQESEHLTEELQRYF